MGFRRSHREETPEIRAMLEDTCSRVHLLSKPDKLKRLVVKFWKFWVKFLFFFYLSATKFQFPSQSFLVPKVALFISFFLSPLYRGFVFPPFSLCDKKNGSVPLIVEAFYFLVVRHRVHLTRHNLSRMGGEGEIFMSFVILMKPQKSFLVMSLAKKNWM